jgi:hypothetical protein
MSFRLADRNRSAAPHQNALRRLLVAPKRQKSRQRPDATRRCTHSFLTWLARRPLGDDSTTSCANGQANAGVYVDFAATRSSLSKDSRQPVSWSARRSAVLKVP